MLRRLLVLGLAPVVLGACATTGNTANNEFESSSTYRPGDMPSRVVRVGRNLVSASELVGTQAADIHQALILIRPEFLRGRGAASINMREKTAVAVYFDNVRAGGLEALRGFPLQGVEAVEFISAANATTRWGTNHSGGVILVRTMR